jgi:hypothetical protein
MLRRIAVLVTGLTVAGFLTTGVADASSLSDVHWITYHSHTHEWGTLSDQEYDGLQIANNVLSYVGDLLDDLLGGFSIF